MQRSANAKLHMRNFGTVNSERFVNNTTNTATFPMMANDTTVLDGEKVTGRNYDENNLIHYTNPHTSSEPATPHDVFTRIQNIRDWITLNIFDTGSKYKALSISTLKIAFDETYLILKFPHIASRELFENFKGS
jgi:hypothetical protein